MREVTAFDEQEYKCQPGDTFEKISARFYMGDKYAKALQRHNQLHPRATAQMANSGTLTAGEKIFIPQAYILEQRYADTIAKPDASTPGATVPASYNPSPSGPPLLPMPTSPPSMPPPQR